MPIKYTKMWKDGSWEFIQEDRVNRFLDEGWTKQPESEKKVTKSNGSKNKISAKAQVTSKASEEKVEEVKVEEDNIQEQDNFTFSYDDFQTAKKED